MKTFTEILPAAWACALINDDTSGLSHDEEMEMDDAVGHLPAPIGCSDESFQHKYNGVLTDCLEYTFPA